MPSPTGNFVALALAILALMPASSQAYKFYVGGRDGWVLSPSEPFNHWAERNRFQLNDTLYFKYDNGTDSVLVVSKDDYFSCNTKNPILSLQDGDSLFKFDRSGPFFFISGTADRCLKGQKLIVVVLAVRHNHRHHAPPPSSSPLPAPPEPQTPTPTPTTTADSPVPAPAKNSAAALGGGADHVFGAVLLSALVGLLLLL